MACKQGCSIRLCAQCLWWSLELLAKYVCLISCKHGLHSPACWCYLPVTSYDLPVRCEREWLWFLGRSVSKLVSDLPLSTSTFSDSQWLCRYGLFISLRTYGTKPQWTCDKDVVWAWNKSLSLLLCLRFYFILFFWQREIERNASFDIICRLIIQETVDRLILLKEGARNDSNL